VHHAQTAIVQLCRDTWNFSYSTPANIPDFSIRKLQYLVSAIRVGLLKFCARCWWVEASSEWRLVKHYYGICVPI